MSDQGVFAVHRGIFDHPMFAPEAFTEREAWLWMISTAVWKATKVRAGRKVVPLERGQLVFSERFLAEKWGWSKTTVRRFLERLKNDAMVELNADHDATRITICNYDKYAFDGTNKRTTGGPPADHSRTKEEEPKKEIIKEEEKKETRAGALSSDEPSDFDAFWDEWPNKVGKPAALKAFNSAIKRGASLWDIQDGMRNYIRDKPPDRSWLNPATFLNQNRWEDRPAAVGAPNGKVSAISSACDSLIDKLNAGFGGPAPEERVRGGEGEADARLLSYGRG